MESTTSLPIDKLVQEATSYLCKMKYSKSSISHYTVQWEKISEYIKEQGEHSFSLNMAMFFVRKKYGIYPNKKLNHNQVFCIRCVTCLDEFNRTGSFKRCHQKVKKLCPEIFLPILKQYLDKKYEDKLSDKTVTSKRIQMTGFLDFLYTYGVSDLKVITAKEVLSFTSRLRESGYSSNSRSCILFNLREFLVFLHSHRFISQPLQDLFPVIFTNKYEKLLSYYELEEIKKLLSYINRSTPIGKRDALIMLLAVQLGMRAGDIRRLEIGDIQWSKCTIKFKQQKTGKTIQLPFSQNTQLAIADYLHNGRPASTNQHIFIRHRAPFEPYGITNDFYYVINKYIIKSGLDTKNRKHGLHSMRHSLANNLLKNNTPIPIITGILGHQDSNTTRSYLRIDIKQLRKVALEVKYE